MTTCGDELCTGLKYVLEEQLQRKNNNETEQQQQNQSDEELGMVPAASEEDTSFDDVSNNNKPETAPPPPTTEKAYSTADTSKAGGEMSSTREIRGTIFMISGCEDSQTSADVSNVSNFSLPDPNGRAGGACTSALLKVLYDDHKAVSNLTFAQVLKAMRTFLSQEKYTQTPQLSSSVELNINQDFYLVPPNHTGTKRAVLIGINYFGQNGELTGCINDCMNMKDYIMNVWGFPEENIVVLTDDNSNAMPTRANILAAYKAVASQSESGDAVFCHYSGHGARIRDDDWGEEDDGYDETLVPVDYEKSGQIRDDDLYNSLVSGLSEGVHLVAVMDCCHSGSVLDLPYKYKGTMGNLFGSSGGGGGIALKMCGQLTCCFLCCAGIVLAIVLPLTLL